MRKPARRRSLTLSARQNTFAFPFPPPIFLAKRKRCFGGLCSDEQGGGLGY